MCQRLNKLVFPFWWFVTWTSHNLPWNSQNHEHQKYLWNFIVLWGNSHAIRHEKTSLQTAMVISLWFSCRFAGVSWTLLWLVNTRSTFLKFFMCSRFSEFHSKPLANGCNIVGCYMLMHQIANRGQQCWICLHSGL